MRVLIPIATMFTAGCNVDNEPDKDRVTVKYDEARIRKAAADTGHTAKAVATGVAHVATGTARAIKREVGNVDVDVKVSREKPAPRPGR